MLYNVSPFTGVQVGQAFQVRIVRGDDFSVDVTVDDRLRDSLRVTSDGKVLRIHLDFSLMSMFSFETRQAVITMPLLESLAISGACRAEVEGFSSDHDLDLQISGASHVRGVVDAGRVHIDLSGASRLILLGRAAELALHASGASKAELEEYGVAKASVDLSGASSAAVDAAQELEVSASGASTLRYRGQPQMRHLATSGASTVKVM
jgi:hypothetical protein